MPKISIIIPIYNVEKYIEECARSLFEQTLSDIEYIFVDDCSPDKSIETLTKVLNNYPNRKAQTRIVHNEKNLGQGITRKNGILAATGDYVIHCDSDDWVELNMYEVLYNTAIQSNADIVMCDAFKNYPNGCQRVMNMADNTDKFNALRNLYTSKRMGTLCCHLVSRKIVQHPSIVWPTWSYTEDLALVFQYVMKANKLATVSKALYHYRDNIQSISYKKHDLLRCDFLKTHALIQSWCKEMGIWDALLPQRLAKAFNEKARKLGETEGSDNNAQKAWLATNSQLGISELIKADLSIKQKVYAMILFMHLMPSVNKVIDIRHRIWS